MQARIANCRIMDPVTGTILRRDILIEGDRILALTEPGQTDVSVVLDAEGKYAVPGFMDAHFHSDSTFLSLPVLSEILLRHGTTAIFINPHEVANVAGLEGVKALLRSSEKLPLRVYLIAPVKVPTAPLLETSGAVFGMEEVREMLNWPETVGVGEIDAHKLVHEKEPYMTFIRLAREKNLAVCGSINGFRGADLQKCFFGGVTDDHESIDGEEALEKISYGGYLHMREGSTEHNIASIVPVLLRYPDTYDRVCLCCDDRTPLDLMEEGGIDHAIRVAVKNGLDPLHAVRMATANPAAYYHMSADYGQLAPGKKADVVLFQDESRIDVTDVFVDGMRVVTDGRYTFETPEQADLPETVRKTIHIPQKLGTEDMLLRSEKDSERVRVVQITPGQIVTRFTETKLSVQNGFIRIDGEEDLEYFVLAERYAGTGNTVPAFVSGFGLKEGAFAVSVSHDHHHLVCVGRDPTDMAAALNRVSELGGGIVVVSGGRIRAELPLPLWGLLSDGTLEETVEAERKINRAILDLGCPFAERISPVSVLSLMSLPVVGDAGFTNRGLVDVRKQKIIPVCIETEE